MLCRYIAVLFVGGWLACQDGEAEVCYLPQILPDPWCIDLSNGVAETPFFGIGATWASYKPVSGCCNDQAVLALNPPCWAKSLKIIETSANSKDYSFHVGDSASNDFWGGGDWGTTDYCAELQIYNGQLRAYNNRLATCNAQTLEDSVGVVGKTHSTSIMVMKNGLQASSLPSEWGFYKTCDNCLFNWDDLYIGMNRIIKLSGDGLSKTGSGLCQVCLQWSTSDPSSTG